MEWNKISRKLIINYEYSMNLKNISDRTKIIIFLIASIYHLTYTKSINPFLGRIQDAS